MKTSYLLRLQICQNWFHVKSERQVKSPHIRILYRYYTLTTKFTLDLKNVRAGRDVEKARREFFRLKQPEPHRAIVALIKPIQGPQDIELELRMDMYQKGKYYASAVANIFIFVTPYSF